MKVSLKWAQYYSNVDLTKIGTDTLIQKIGSQLGEIEGVESWGPRFDGIVVAKVISCEKHPNADKLHVCLIDDGKTTKVVKRNEKGLIEVVCGAPNVQAGMTVAWLPPGVTVPTTLGKDPLVLEAREIRGVVSNGMLASASELGISNDHSGLLEIKPDDVGRELAKPGTPFEKLYGLDDIVIDIENKMFTHRPDCFGILGVARELAGIQGLAFKSPDWYSSLPTNKHEPTDLKLTVKNEAPKLVPRFMTHVVENITVGPSPTWVQTGLTRVGMKPINNIVDLSNFYMCLTAQPTHAFDYDKVKALSGSTPTLKPRMAKAGEELMLLGGKKITLTPEDIVIATDTQVVGLAGIMGGAETEVDENTKTIIIECATFDMYAVRRSSMRHGLFTDAVTRFNKGQSPLQNDRVLAHMVADLKQSGARPTSLLIDLKQPGLDKPQTVRVSPQFINDRLGLSLSAKQITQLLQNVEFKVMAAGAKQLAIAVPFWRTDIAIPEDIVEEVGRLYGYDHLPLDLPKRDLTPIAPNKLLALKTSVRDILSRAGANELLTYSFVHGDLLQKVGQDTKSAFELGNALSPDLQYYRMSLLPSLLDKVHPNIKAGHDRFALFEIGKAHIKGELNEEKVPKEFEMTAMVYADKLMSSSAPYYQVRGYLDYLGSQLGVSFEYIPIRRQPDFAVTRPFDIERSAFVQDRQSGALLGVIGEFSAQTRRQLKLPAQSAGFEIGTADLLKALEHIGSGYNELSKYPRVEQDICLRTAADLPYAQLEQCIQDVLEPHRTGASVDLRPIDVYRREDDHSHKQTTFRITVASHERTLTDKEVSKILDEIALSAAQKLTAERV